jgi:hypothetical protein
LAIWALALALALLLLPPLLPPLLLLLLPPPLLLLLLLPSSGAGAWRLQDGQHDFAPDRTAGDRST